MFKAYLLLFCSFFISAVVVATEHEIKMDNSDHCANAAMDNSEKILFTSQPEDRLLETMPMNHETFFLRIGLMGFKEFINDLKGINRKR